MAGMKLPEVLLDDTVYKFTDFDNFFDIYQDEESNFFYNLNSTMYFDVPDSHLKTYICQHDIHWPTISYNIYGTVRLAWLLMKINEITPDLAFKIIPSGSKVKYLDKSDIATVVSNFGNK